MTTGFFSDMWSAARHEVRALRRDPGLLLAGFVVPLFWCLVLAFTFGTGLMRGLPVAWVDLDHSAASRQAARQIDAAPTMALTAYETPAAAEEALREGRVFAVITVPEDWEKAQRLGLSGPGGAISAAFNRTYYPVSTMLEADLKLALADATIQVGAEKRTAAAGGGPLSANGGMLRALLPETYFLGNAAFNFSAYLLAPLLPGVMALGAVLAFASALVRDWRAGTVRAWVAAAGGSPFAAILGKLLPWFALYALGHALWVAGFAGWAGWAPAAAGWASVGWWLLAGWLLMLAMAGMALLITSTSLTWVLAVTTVSALTAPAFPFTGFSYPIDAMSPGAALVAELLPLTHFLRAQAAVWVLGSPTPVILETLGHLGIFVLVFFGAGLPIYARRVATFAEKERDGAPAHIETMPRARDEDYVGVGFFGLVRRGFARMVLSRDAFIVFVVGVAFYLVYYAWPYRNEQIEHVPVAVTDLDRSAASREFIRTLSAAPAVDLKFVATDPADARAAFERQTVDVIVTVPERFAERLARGENTMVPILGNGAYPVKTRALQAALTAVLTSSDFKYGDAALVEIGTDPTSTWAAQGFTHGAAPSLTTLDRFNTISGYGTYIVPLVAPLIVQAIVVIGAAITIGQWMRRRDPLVLAALKPSGFAALFTALFAVALLWNLYAQGTEFLRAEFPGFANPEGTFILLVFYAGACAAFALGFTALWGRARTAAPAAVVMSAPLLFASGAVWPKELILSPFVHAVAAFVPTTPAIPALAAVSQAGAGTEAVLPALLHLLALTLFWSAVAYWAFQKRLGAADGNGITAPVVIPPTEPTEPLAPAASTRQNSAALPAPR